ncbi:MAG: hypothetical protein R3234_11415 [Thermoanaerobaculia bacterium]|nr:hypothetical protein [Thermoanaerobaculia bacterium]
MQSFRPPPSYRLPSLLILISCLALAVPSGAAEHRFGVGVNYWETVDDLVDEEFDVEEDGLAPVLTYQYRPGGLIGFQVDLEYFEEGFGGSTSEALSPQAYVTVGGGIYGAIGVGVTYSDDFDGEFSDPFWAARAGLDFELLPKIHIDIHANYRADTFDELDQASSDTVTLGIALRAGL